MLLVTPLMSHLQPVSPQDQFYLLLMQKIPEQPTLTSNSTAGISSPHCDTVASNLQAKQSTSAISKYLVQYVTSLPTKKNTANLRITGSRVLTIAEGYEILQEKEEKEEK